MSVFESDKEYKNKIPTNIKDFVIERIKKGEGSSKIVKNVRRVFKQDVSLMFIFRIRKQYIKLTGKHLQSYKEFHNHPTPKKRTIICKKT